MLLEDWSVRQNQLDNGIQLGFKFLLLVRIYALNWLVGGGVHHSPSADKFIRKPVNELVLRHLLPNQVVDVVVEDVREGF